MKKHLALILALLMLITLAGCAGEGETPTMADADTETQGQPAAVDFSQTDADMFTDRDGQTAYSGGVEIRFDGDAVTCSDAGVKINGTTVTITRAGTYVLSGTLDNGMVIVDAADTDKLQVVLNGVSIHSETSVPLYIREADKVFLTLKEGTENTLSSAGTYAAVDDSNIDGTLFSRQDLTVNGSGRLTVTAPAGHGIVCKDDLVITGGAIAVTAASHGIDANDSVRIKDVSLTVDAGKDGIHCENSDDTSLGFVYISGGSLEVEAEGDGISAGSWLQITGGTFELTCGGGSENGSQPSSGNWGDFMGGGRPGMGGRPGGNSSATTETDSASMKGIKSGNSMLICGGAFTIDSADDAIHSDISATVSGGTFQIASGDDAIHAEEELVITAGHITVTESYEGLEALHIKVQGGDLRIVASDDGLNAAGGVDSSGTGGRDEMFGGRPGMGGGRPGMGGGMGGASNGTIQISGGDLYINASGDGIDANGSLTISGGHTVVVGPTRGDTATLDYDTSAVITGGTFIGTGASGMAQTFSDSGQGVMAVSVGGVSAGTKITLSDTSGKELISYAPELDFAVVIISTPEMVSGQRYTITVGDQSGEFEAS